MSDKLYFYSKSRDATLYTELAGIKDWRKTLSNFHVSPFKYEGFTYNTIEHVFQAKKIEIADKELALIFTVESGHEIALGNGEVARKNRKLVKLTPEQLRIWCVMKDNIMFNAAVQKYKTCKQAVIVLKATNDAELWHIVSRSKPVRFEHLEKIRDTIKNLP